MNLQKRIKYTNIGYVVVQFATVVLLLIMLIKR